MNRITAGRIGVAQGACHAQRRAGEDAREEAIELVVDGQRLAQVLEEDHLAVLAQDLQVLLHVAGLDEAARGDDGRDLCRRAGRGHVHRPRREVQHGGHAAEGMKAEEGDEAAGGIGQQHAHIALARRHLRHAAAEDEASHHQPVIGRRLALDVFEHHVAAPMGVARVEQRFEQRAVDVGGAEDHVGHHVIEAVRLVLAKRRAAHALRRVELHGRQEGDGDLGEPAQPQLAAHAREGRVERAVDPDRQHARLGHLGDGAGPLIDLHQRARHGEAAFGEDHHLAALLQLIHQHAQRHGVGRVDGDHVEQREGGLRPPGLGHMAVDGEARPLGQEGGEQRPVEIGAVVGDDHRLAARRAVGSPCP